MLNWNSLTWVDHSNSRRVNNCRVLMKFTMREARAGHGPGLHCQSRRESRQISGVQAGHMMMIVLSLVWGGVHTTPVLTSESASVGRDNRWERESDIRADPGHDIWSLVSRGRSEILIPLQGRSHTIVIYVQTPGEWGWKWVWTQRIRRLQWLTLLCPDIEEVLRSSSPWHRGGMSSLLLPQWTET